MDKSEKPKLLIYSDSHVLGGADRYLLMIIPALLEDWRISFVYRDDVNFSALTGKMKQLGVDCLPLAKPKFSFGNIFALKKIFKELNPNLILFNQGSFYTSKAARLAAKLAKSPQVVIQHGSTFEGKKFYSIPNRLFAKLTFSGVKMIAPSASSQAFFKKYFPKLEPPTIINHGIDLARFDPSKYNRKTIRRQMGIPESSPVLIFIGRLEEDKNPDLVIDLLKECDNPEIQVFFLGSGSQRQKLEKRAKYLFPKQIKFLGNVPDPAIYLAAADILIQPSRSESFSLVVVEAMAMGIVPVAFRIDSLPEIINEESLIADYPNIGQMAKIITGLLKNNTKRKEIARSCQDRAKEKFALQRMQRDIKNYFKQFGTKNG